MGAGKLDNSPCLMRGERWESRPPGAISFQINVNPQKGEFSSVVAGATLRGLKGLTQPLDCSSWSLKVRSPALVSAVP